MFLINELTSIVCIFAKNGTIYNNANDICVNCKEWERDDRWPEVPVGGGGARQFVARGCGAEDGGVLGVAQAGRAGGRIGFAPAAAPLAANAVDRRRRTLPAPCPQHP